MVNVTILTTTPPISLTTTTTTQVSYWVPVGIFLAFLGVVLTLVVGYLIHRGSHRDRKRALEQAVRANNIAEEGNVIARGKEQKTEEKREEEVDIDEDEETGSFYSAYSA